MAVYGRMNSYYMRVNGCVARGGLVCFAVEKFISD
jgi:hypothetical protein